MSHALSPIARTLAAVIVAVVIAAVFAAPAAAQATDPRTATLRDVAFIAGNWRGEMEGGVAEEDWKAPLGDNMMGMFRYVKDGKATF